MRQRLSSRAALLIVVVLAALAVGVGLAIATGSGSSDDDSDALVINLNYRANAVHPAPHLRNVLSTDGLELKAWCQLANGLPVLGFAASSTAAASLGFHAQLQSDETVARVFHDVHPDQLISILGPVGAGNGATGTLTYSRPEGQAVTVSFVAMTEAPGAECAVGGTVVRSPG
jgi:hypothetical protein